MAAAEAARLLWGSVVHRPYVFAFLACFVVFALHHLGTRRTLTFACSTFAIAFAAEWSSTHNGFPFGPYAYDEATRSEELWLLNVPSWDTASFVFLSYFSLVLAAAVRTPREAREAAPWPALRSFRTALLGGLLMTLLDVVIDPVTLEGDRWFLGRVYSYPWHGFWFGVTAANFAGWFFVGVATQWAFQGLLALPFSRGPWRRVGPGFAWAALGVYAGVLGFMLVVTVAIGDHALAATSAAVTTVTLAALVRGLRGPRHEPMVVCAATATEAAACRRGIAAAGVEGLEVLATGVGKELATAALAQRLRERPLPALIVSSGFAGALGLGPPRNAIVTAHTLFTETGEELAMPIGQFRLAPGAQPCSLLERGTVMPAGEEATFASPFTLADMESVALARLARGAGIPFGVLRVVTDTPKAPFPPFVARIGAALSTRRPLSKLAAAASALAAALRRPGSTLQFIRASLSARSALQQAWQARADSLATPGTPGWRPVDAPLDGVRRDDVLRERR